MAVEPESSRAKRITGLGDAVNIIRGLQFGLESVARQEGRNPLSDRRVRDALGLQRGLALAGEILGSAPGDRLIVDVTDDLQVTLEVGLRKQEIRRVDQGRGASQGDISQIMIEGHG